MALKRGQRAAFDSESLGVGVVAALSRNKSTPDSLCALPPPGCSPALACSPCFAGVRTGRGAVLFLASAELPLAGWGHGESSH